MLWEGNKLYIVFVIVLKNANNFCSPTPNITENPTETTETAGAAAVAATPTEAKSNDEAAKEKLKIDTSSPLTTLQIRLADGTRLASQFNLTHTVADIQEYIQT